MKYFSTLMTKMMCSDDFGLWYKKITSFLISVYYGWAGGLTVIVKENRPNKKSSVARKGYLCFTLH